MKLSIIIPVYNEVNTILEVIRRVQKEKFPKEIIIIDDCSKDGTTELLREIKDENISVTFLGKNMGKGHAIRTAIKQITGDITIIQDADLEYYPDEYGILIDKILAGKADVVYGTRFLGKHRVFYFYHLLGNATLNLISNFLLNTTFTDLMTGYKAFKSDCLKRLVLKANRFGIETEITAEICKRSLVTYEVPISYDGRCYWESKKIKWFDFFDCIYWLIRAYFRGIDVGTETLLRMRIMKNNNLWTYRKIKPFLGENVLELGSGLGTISNLMVSKDRNIILTDRNDEYINYLNKRFIYNPWVKVIKTDICEINTVFGSAKVDTIVGVNILEHIEDDFGLLKKLQFILTNGGKLLLIVPAHESLFGSLDKELSHFRRYSKRTLTAKIKEAGFDIEKIEFMNSFSAIGWFLSYRILKGKHIPKTTAVILDKFIPFIEAIERYIKFPFGLSLFVVARKK